MKKLFLAVMAVATVALVGCKKEGGNEPIIGPTPGGDTEVKVPAVDATPGAITLLVKFDVAPCDGYEIRFVGDHAENAWDPATAPAMVAVGDGWYKYLIRPGKNDDGTDKDAMAGRPIQCSATDADWSHDWSHDPAQIVDLKGVEDGMKATNEFGETNLNFTAAHAADGVIVAFQCKAWNVSPCAAAEKYSLTFKAPAFCDPEYDLEGVGSFEGWGTAPVKMTKNGNVYTAEIQAKSGDEIKFRGINPDDAWAIQVEGYDAEKDEWNEMGNQKLGDEKSVTFDWSDPAVYRWKQCAAAE